MNGQRGFVAATAALVVLAIAWRLLPPAADGQQQRDRKAGGGNPRSVNVRDLGARGDGRGDDTAAIQEAVDRGGSVVFPRGIYRITAPVVIELEKTGFVSLDGGGVARVQMDGAGPAFRFVGTHGGTADPDSVDPGVWEHQRAPRVTGLEIVGSHEEAVGIEATGTMQLTVSQAVLRKLLHGIHLVNRNRNVLLSACHIYENRGVGVYYDQVNLHQSNISACHISYNQGGGVVFRGGEVRNVHITGCDIEANHDADGPPTANVLIDCTGGSTAEVAIVGCTIQHAHGAPDSANIRVLGKGTYRRGAETLEANWGNITIADNVLSDVQKNIELIGARGVTITGNTIWQGFEYNVRIVESSHLAIANNMCERNPPYGYAGPTANAVLLQNCEDATLSGNEFHNIQSEFGVSLEDCRRVNVTGCNILDCEGVELRLANVSHSRVSDCLIRDDRPKAKNSTDLVFQLQGGSGNLLADNLLSGKQEFSADSVIGEH